jgi:ribonuclease BN (tRNA processing enzyme)
MDMSLRLLILVLGFAVVPLAFAEYEPSNVTQVVMLGTGTPNPNPSRSGPAIAIVVNDTPYIVDFGPGVIRQAAAMSPQFGGKIVGLDTKRIAHAFLTHLHSDHTAGYPDLILTPWTMGRDVPLQVYGPEGIVEMTEHVLEAWQEDIRYRVYGLQPANNNGWRVNAHVVKEGVVYEDDNVRVEAFPVVHGSWPNAFGYRFTTPDRVIVVSGDAAPGGSLEKYTKDADILIHEAYSGDMLKASGNEFWQEYYKANHTSGSELGEIAERAGAGLLVLYHLLPVGVIAADVLDEVRTKFGGEVVVASDLDVY